MSHIITEVDLYNDVLQVIQKDEQTYDVLVNDVVKHPNCTAHDVIRALGHYICGMSYNLDMLGANRLK